MGSMGKQLMQSDDISRNLEHSEIEQLSHVLTQLNNIVKR